MSRVSTALYRRYRPETFADVIGQEHVTAPLMAALDNGRVTHAYLFSGPRGCGKTTSARIFARCLNCANGPTSTPCGTCDSCVELARGGAGSIDVVEMDAASHGGVDDARELRERAAFAPARDRFKVFIIDEAHMVSTQGFNALLKLVEEPPPHVKFVFATTEPEKVIGTIRSRTHHYPFRLVPPEQLTGYLESLAQAEGVQVDSGVLPLVVRAGAGSVRDSLSVLDQLIAGTDDGVLGYEGAVALLGFTHGTLLDDTVDALAARDGASLFRVVDRVIESGHAPRRFVEDLLERLRDLIVVRAAGEQAASVLRAVPADQLERMRTQASHLSAATLSRAADLVNEALTEMAGATSPRLQLELLCARLLLPAADDGAEGFAVRLDRLEGALGSPQHGGAAAVPAARPVPPAPPPAATPVSPPAATPVSPPAEPPRAAAEPAGTAPALEQAAHEPAARGAVPPIEGAPSAEPSPSADDAVRPGGGAAEDDTSAGSEGTRVPEHRPAAVEDRSPAPESPPAGAPPAAAPGGAPEAQGPPAPDAPAPAPAEGAGAGGLTTAEVRRRWPEVLETLARIKRTTWALISQDAQIVDLDAATLQLGFSTSGLASAFRNGQHAEFLQRALVETLGLDVRIEPIVADGTSGAGGFGGPAGSGGGPGGPSGPGGRPSGPGGSTPGGAGPTGSGPATSWDTPTAPPAQPEASWDAPVPPSAGNSAPSAASTPPSGTSMPSAASTPPPWDVPEGEPPGDPEGDSGSSAAANNTAQAAGAGPVAAPSAADSLVEPSSRPADAMPSSGPAEASPSASPAEAALGPEAAPSPAIPPWEEPEPPKPGAPAPAGAGPASYDPGPDPAAEFAEPSEPERAAPSAAPEWPQEPQRPAAPNPAGDPPPSGPAPGSTSPREQALAAAREARGASLSRPTPVASAPETPDPGTDYDPDPNDPDIESTGLAGAPLVARLLGGTVIDEILESPEGGDR